MREAKSDYYAAEFENSYGNPRKFWDTIRKILPKTRPTESLGKQEDLKNANLFNDYFSDIGFKTSAKAINGRLPDYDLLTAGIPPTENIFSFRSATSVELRHLIGKMPKYKAPGVDGVNGYIVHLAFPVIGDLLLKIFNLSLKVGIFPEDWKMAIIKPLHKTGAIDLPSNFRPVALLRLFGKILERLVFNQLRPYFERVASKCQFGFLTGKSTETALLKVCDFIHVGMEQKKLTTLVLLDMSKAFDCVCHSILLSKLFKYGIQGTTLSWFQSYLSIYK